MALLLIYRDQRQCHAELISPVRRDGERGLAARFRMVECVHRRTPANIQLRYGRERLLMIFEHSSRRGLLIAL